MANLVTIESLDRMHDNLRTLITEQAKRLPGMRHCDLRIEVREEKRSGRAGQ